MKCVEWSRLAMFAVAAVGSALSSVSVTAASLPSCDGVTSRIVGGSEAPAALSGWQVLVMSKGMCGGSLIRPDWVLTAAHCVKSGDAPVLAPADVEVQHGGLNRRSLQRYAVREIHIPRGYQRSMQGNDIALLRLEQPIAPADRSIPLLPQISTRTAADATCAYVTGWGSMSARRPDQRGAGNTAEDSQVAAVPVVSRPVCSAALKATMQSLAGAHVDIPADQLCAGYAGGGKDSCQGDSGGPLLIQRGGQWFQVGVVSWGLGCAQANAYGLYTDVSKHADWIRGILSRSQ